jgi:hypothetical protein
LGGCRESGRGVKRERDSWLAYDRITKVSQGLDKCAALFVDSLRTGSLFLNLKAAYALLKEACSAWAEDNAPSMGDAVAFYVVFSLGPVLIVVISVAGLAFGQKAAEGKFSRQFQGLVGETGARAVQAILRSAGRHRSSATPPPFGFLAGRPHCFMGFFLPAGSASMLQRLVTKQG